MILLYLHTVPTNDTYPTEKKPLVLFKETDFNGQYLPVAPDDFKRFAYNQRSERQVEYKSMRVLHNRTVSFSRNIIYTQVLLCIPLFYFFTFFIFIHKEWISLSILWTIQF